MLTWRELHNPYADHRTGLAVHPAMVFSADLDPVSEAAEALSQLCPANPFCTPAYLQAMRAGGTRVWRLAVGDQNTLSGGCFCYLQAGRFNRSLIIPSLPAVAVESVFWEGLLNHIRTMKVSRLEVNSYFSPPVTIPVLKGETRRRTRHEYFVDLQAGELWTILHENHRRRVRKASKAGLQMRCMAEASNCREHAQLMASSMERRTNRGEQVPTEFEVKSFQPLLQSGAGRLYQAVRGTEVLSSVLLLLARQGAYLHSGGTSPEGMELGASHWLHHELMRMLQTEGKTIYNLGGTEDDSSGLALFKSRFGAQVRRLEAVEAFPGGNWRSLLSRAARRLTSSSQRSRQPTPAKVPQASAKAPGTREGP